MSNLSLKMPNNPRDFFPIIFVMVWNECNLFPECLNLRLYYGELGQSPSEDYAKDGYDRRIF